MTYGQSKDILIPFSSSSVSQATFTVTYDNLREKKKSLQFGVQRISEQADLNQIIRHRARLEFVHCIRTTFEKMRPDKTKPSSKDKQSKTAIDPIKQLNKEITKYAYENDEFIKDLLVDLTGQVHLALENHDWFMKWGIHYLPSLTRKYDQRNTKRIYIDFLCLGAHLLQFCNNFKDPGVQHYGKGALFSTVRDDMDGIFCGLPAPKRSQTGAQIDMTVFHNSGGGCFHGNCTVRLMDGTTKLVKDVQPGDCMAPFGGTITYVIKTKYRNRKSKMVVVSICIRFLLIH